MSNEEMELQAMGYKPVYDYTQYSHDNDVNVIPEEAFKRLVHDTFKTMTDVLRETYGPYGSTVIISDQGETITTKDGFNVVEAMGFSHQYKRMVYLTIKKICERVNRNVGDGTTSCILLAGCLFNILNDLIKTPNDKREILNILTSVERKLDNVNKIDTSYDNYPVEPLTLKSMKNIISLASNYDEELTNILMEALSPTTETSEMYGTENEKVCSIRNVVAEADVTTDSNKSLTYSIYPLPGNYHVNISMDTEFALALTNPQFMYVVIYDHAFSSTDWKNLIDSYGDRKGEKVLILTRAINKTVLNSDIPKYVSMQNMIGALKDAFDMPFYFASVKSTDVQSELRDLAVVLNTSVRTLNDCSNIDFDNTPKIEASVFRKNTLCLNITQPIENTEYIENIKHEMDIETSNSYVKTAEYKNRLRALTLSSNDTLIVVHGSSSLETKMIMDKIDDCISIINSANSSGVVGNLLGYGYSLINNLHHNAKSKLEKQTYVSILNSISGLLNAIWKSKYGKEADATDKTPDGGKDFFAICNTVYKKHKSYDIVTNTFVDPCELPTSAQYDLEVIIAAISIVKFLLTSRAFIFDAHLMKPTGDQGRYVLE